MKPMLKRNWDVMLGAGGVGASAWIATAHEVLGLAAIGITVFVLILRARKEWKHRDDPPKRPD